MMTAHQLIKKWVTFIGVGFDPMLTAAEYSPSFSVADGKDYRRDMHVLFNSFDTLDALEEAVLEEMKAQRLI